MYLHTPLLLCLAHLASAYTPVAILFFNDEACGSSNLGWACWEHSPNVCCDSGTIYGSALLWLECVITLAQYVPTAFQGDQRCGVILGTSGPEECMVSDLWQIASGYWTQDFCFLSLAEADAARELVERNVEALNGTAGGECQKVDMHILKVGEVLHGIRINSSDGESLRALEDGSVKQRKFMLAHSHVSRPWRHVKENVSLDPIGGW